MGARNYGWVIFWSMGIVVGEKEKRCSRPLLEGVVSEQIAERRMNVEGWRCLCLWGVWLPLYEQKVCVVKGVR